MDLDAQSGSVTFLSEKALELIDVLNVDPAHSNRIRSVVEAARLVSDAAYHLPALLGAPEFAVFLDAAEVLARDVEGAGENTAYFGEDPELHEIELIKGPLSAGLHGMIGGLKALASASGSKVAAPAPEIVASQLLQINRAEFVAITKASVGAMGQVERIVDELDDAPVLRQQAWGILVNMGYAIALLSDTSAIDREKVLHLVGKCATALFKSREQIGEADPNGVLEAFNALAPALDLVVDCLHAASARRQQGLAIVLWRKLSRGQVRLDDNQVEDVIRSTPLMSLVHSDEIRGAARALRAEWAGSV